MTRSTLEAILRKFNIYYFIQNVIVVAIMHVTSLATTKHPDMSVDDNACSKPHIFQNQSNLPLAFPVTVPSKPSLTSR